MNTSYNVSPNTSDSLASLVPIGSIHMWPTTTAPDNYRICDGLPISRLQNVELFNVIGTTFGAGNGTTSFNLPDMRARFPFGLGGSAVIGQTGGAATVTLIVDNLPQHGHSVIDPSHTHTTVRQGTGFASSPGGFGNTCDQGGTVTAAVTGITIPSSLKNVNGTDLIGGLPIPIAPPFMVFNFIIRSS